MVESVESGFMTKDLALCIHGSQMERSHYLNTEEYMNKLEEMLAAKMIK